MQTSRMSKWSMAIFFINPDLVLMQQHLNYKKKDKMRPLLIKLSYNNVV